METERDKMRGGGNEKKNRDRVTDGERDKERKKETEGHRQV